MKIEETVIDKQEENFLASRTQENRHRFRVPDLEKYAPNMLTDKATTESNIYYHFVFPEFSQQKNMNKTIK